jgi:hypothetical protein
MADTEEGLKRYPRFLTQVLRQNVARKQSVQTGGDCGMYVWSQANNENVRFLLKILELIPDMQILMKVYV